jgi:hypothetical protein
VADDHVPTRDVAYFDEEGYQLAPRPWVHEGDNLIAFYRARLDEEQAELDPYLHDPHEGASDDERHQRHAHPNFEYRTTEGQRKAWPYVDDPPEGDGWELNQTSVDPAAFARFEYTEERYWRRRLPGDPRVWTPSPKYVRQAADIRAKRKIVIECLKEVEREAGAGRRYPASTAWALAVTTLRLLALPYEEHPDYDERWRP